MTRPPIRSTAQRQQDTRIRLANDIDAWIATADPASGNPTLIPLSYLWDGESLLICTAADSATSRNLIATGKVKVGVGTTRDVVLIDGTIEPITAENLSDETAVAFANHTEWDPREEADAYTWFRIYPKKINAWRESNELTNRTIMSNAQWHS